MSPALRLTLARATAWALLLAGWVGVGSLAQVLAPSVLRAFALVALWLLALGAAASVATRDSLAVGVRRPALAGAAALAAAALAWCTRGGGMTALLLAVIAWACLTALASGAVRSLRLTQVAPPGPPIAAASLGALCAALVLADPGDLKALTLRLGVLVLASAGLLAALQRADTARTPASHCRAGLFDCSLPAWPTGAWHDARQWPALLAGLAMMPMMAALPLMVGWCRSDAVPPQAVVLLHFAGMFGPALLLRRSFTRWSQRTMSTVCAACMAAGLVALAVAPSPWDWLLLAAAHGGAWGIAWAGQLWSPDRRSRQGASPLRAGLGYAALTIAFGGMVHLFGASGASGTHVALGVAVVLAWLYAGALLPSVPDGELHKRV